MFLCNLAQQLTNSTSHWIRLETRHPSLSWLAKERNAFDDNRVKENFATFMSNAKHYALYCRYVIHECHRTPPRLNKTAAFYNGSWVFVFLCSPTSQNSPELHCRFMNSFIHPSLVGSLIPRQQIKYND